MRNRLLAIAALIGSTPAAAQTCDVEIVAVPQPVALVVEPFAGVPATGSAVLVLRAPRPVSLDLRVRQDAGSGGGEPFAFTFEPSSTTMPVRRIGDDRYRLDLAQDQQARVEFSVAAGIRTVPAPGRSDLSFSIDASDAATGAVCLRETTLPVSIAVPSRAEMNLAGASGSFNSGRSFYSIDFGSVRSREERSLAIQFRANGEARLSFRSAHGGRMVNIAAPDFAIPYDVLIAGHRLDLQGEAIEPLAPARTLAGTSLPMRIVLGDLPPLPAGKYSDTITVTITAL